MMASKVRRGLLCMGILVVVQLKWAVAEEYFTSKCGQTIDISTELSEQLKSQVSFRYGANEGCTVTVETSLLKKVLVTFRSVDIEESSLCSLDYLEIYNGPFAFSRNKLATICGSSTPSAVASTGNSIILTFRSNSSLEGRGFDIIVTSFSTGSCALNDFECDNSRCIDKNLKDNFEDNCGDSSDETFEYFTSKCGQTIDISTNFTEQLKSQVSFRYDANEDCTVTVETSLLKRVLVTFRSVDIEESSLCSLDYLEIYNGPFAFSRNKLATICGSSTPSAVASTMNSITLTFRSDSSVEGSGFDIIVTSFSTGSCALNDFECDNSRCIDKNLKDNFEDNCGDSSDETFEYFTSKCGQTIDISTNFTEQLKSQVSFRYDANEDCTVTVETSLLKRVLVTFRSVDIEESSLCSLDYLEIYNGPFAFSRNKLATICGSSTPSAVASTMNSITLTFRSDSSVEGSGFDIIVTSFSTGSCALNDFECDNGRCIDKNLKDNFEDNCGDSSDETFGSCGLDDFECDNGRCIDKNLKDNFEDNCGDSSDETFDDLVGWGIGLIVGVIVGCVVGAIFLCVCCGCLCYRLCCKSKAPTSTASTVVVLTGSQQQPLAYSQQPGAPPPAYNEPPMAMQQIPGQYGQQQTPYNVTT